MSGWRMTLGVLAVLLAGLLLVRDEGPGAAAPPTESAAPPASAAAPPSLSSSLPSPAVRNVFAYGAPSAPEWVAPRAPVAPAPASAAPPAPASAPPPVRLVGVVLRGGALKAALALGGEVVMLGVGEERDGYRVESIDEESGVRVVGPGGAVWVLTPY